MGKILAGLAGALGVTTVFGLIIAIILLLVFWPFVGIWTLNTLFPTLAIGYSFETWLAMLILIAAIKSKTKRAFYNTITDLGKTSIPRTKITADTIRTF